MPEPMYLIIQELVKELHETNRIMNDIRTDIHEIHRAIVDLDDTLQKVSDYV